MLATTGELPQLDRPGALNNISYDIEVPAPLLKCRFSNDTEIAQLLDIACQELPLGLITSCSINRLNLRYSVNTSDVNTTWSRQIGYIGYHYEINQNGTIFIAIAQPSALSPNTTVLYQHAIFTRRMSQPSSTLQKTFNRSGLLRSGILVQIS